MERNDSYVKEILVFGIDFLNTNWVQYFITKVNTMNNGLRATSLNNDNR